MNRSELERAFSALPIAQYVFFRTEELTFSPHVREICRQECPRYGKTWACPPAVGEFAECKERCLSYPEGLLLVTLAETPDSSDLEQALKTRPAHEAITRRAAELLKEQGIAPLVLSAESCALCENCTYPDAPCRHPEQLFPCIESHGIVVSVLAEKYGIDFQYGNNVVTWFSLLLFKE